MTCPDLPLTCGSVQAEALCDVHAQSARTVQPGDTSGTPLAVPPMNARPSAHQLVETRPRVRSTAPTVRLDHGCRVGRSRRERPAQVRSCMPGPDPQQGQRAVTEVSGVAAKESMAACNFALTSSATPSKAGSSAPGGVHVDFLEDDVDRHEHRTKAMGPARRTAPSTRTSTAPNRRCGQPSIRESCLMRCPLLRTGRAWAASGSMCEVKSRYAWAIRRCTCRDSWRRYFLPCAARLWIQTWPPPADTGLASEQASTSLTHPCGGVVQRPAWTPRNLAAAEKSIAPLWPRPQ